MTLDSIAQVFIGFSIVAAAILLIAYLFFLTEIPRSNVGRLACTGLLVALSGMQVFHWQVVGSGLEAFDSRLYTTFLLLAPPTFFFFSREILMPEARTGPIHWLHLAPLASSVFIPLTIVVPVALFIGAAYSVWFVKVVYELRRTIKRFRFELFFFTLFALLASVVLALGLSRDQFGNATFYLAYALFICVAMVLIVAAFISFPHLLTDFSEAARMAYATSTLGAVDVEQKVAELQQLMQGERVFQNENLTLNLLAEELGLSAHQLSELINTHFDKGFSRYIREQRVSAAVEMLRKEPAASVLSIGLSVGFRSQSNFYTAFREITGQSPGNYRKSGHPAL